MTTTSRATLRTRLHPAHPDPVLGIHPGRPGHRVDPAAAGRAGAARHGHRAAQQLQHLGLLSLAGAFAVLPFGLWVFSTAAKGRPAR